jgi:hypothetical protein
MENEEPALYSRRLFKQFEHIPSTPSRPVTPCWEKRIPRRKNQSAKKDDLLVRETRVRCKAKNYIFMSARAEQLGAQGAPQVPGNSNL